METIDHNSADESQALSHTDNAEVKNKTAETVTISRAEYEELLKIKAEYENKK